MPRRCSRIPARAYVSRYALGRDYHKVLRARLQRLAERIAAEVGPFGYRVFTDSAPVMEVALAAQARASAGAASTRCCSSRDAGSYLLSRRDLHRPAAAGRRAGRGALRHLQRCIDACPTRRIVAPYELDARRCISYLTIEHKGAIPERAAAAHRQSRLRLRRLPARRARGTSSRRPRAEPDFARAQRARRGDARRAVRVDAKRSSTRGSPAARSAASATSAGCATSRWGSATRRRLRTSSRPSRSRAHDPSALVREHVAWALRRHAPV